MEEKKVVTVTTRPDGTKQTSTAVERVKVEKKDKKDKKPVKSYVREKSPVRQKSPVRSRSPPKHHTSAVASSAGVPRCSACSKKCKTGANFCEHCGGRVVISTAPGKHSCGKCHAKIKKDAKFCEVW